MPTTFSTSLRGQLILLLGCLYDLFIYRQTNFPGEEKGHVLPCCVQRHRGNRPWKHRPGLVAAIELDSYLSNFSSNERQWDDQQLASVAQVEIGR